MKEKEPKTIIIAKLHSLRINISNNLVTPHVEIIPCKFETIRADFEVKVSQNSGIAKKWSAKSQRKIAQKQQHKNAENKFRNLFQLICSDTSKEELTMSSDAFKLFKTFFPHKIRYQQIKIIRMGRMI